MHTLFDPLVFIERLVATIHSTLLFTCYCGVADDAGWETIRVLHSKDKVSRTFRRDGLRKFFFARCAYILAIQECGSRINLADLPLAVERAVWP